LHLPFGGGIVVEEVEKGPACVGTGYREAGKRRRTTTMTTAECFQTPETVLPRQLILDSSFGC
jgi:hypothetical protein